MRSLPDNSRLLSGNRQLPEDKRQSMVMLRFLEPYPPFDRRHEFLRIHLTRAMLTGGEQGFYQPQVTRPQLVGVQTCARCYGRMHRVGPWDWQCQNQACRSFGLTQIRRPPRGVIGLLVPPGTLRVNEAGREVMTQLVLVLDRRYDPLVLAAIYRTAGQLGEEMRWPIK